MTFKSNSQAVRMIDYMHEHGSITTLEAVLKLGILSPTKVICEIRKRYGLPIEKETIKITNRYGEDVYIRRYSIRKEESNETV